MDIIIVIILLLGILIGFKEGFINVLFGLIGFFLSLILSLIFYKSFVAHVIPITGLDTKIYQIVQEKVQNYGASQETSINLPLSLSETFDVSAIINQSASTAADKISTFIINAIAIIILFILFSILISIIRFILNKIAQLPVLNMFNRVAGAALGLVRVYLLILVIFLGISIGVAMDQFLSVKTMIDNSIISKNIYETNILLKYISFEKDTNEEETV